MFSEGEAEAEIANFLPASMLYRNLYPLPLSASMVKEKVEFYFAVEQNKLALKSAMQKVIRIRKQVFEPFAVYRTVYKTAF